MKLQFDKESIKSNIRIIVCNHSMDAKRKNKRIIIFNNYPLENSLQQLEVYKSITISFLLNEL